jgi:hypothetical protein
MLWYVWAFWISAIALLVFLAFLWTAMGLWIKIEGLEERIKELEYDKAHEEEWSD